MLPTPILNLIILALSAVSASSAPTGPTDTDLVFAHEAGSRQVTIHIPSGGQITSWSAHEVPWASVRDPKAKPQELAGEFSPALVGPTDYTVMPFGIPPGDVNETTVYKVDHTFGWTLQEGSNEVKGRCTLVRDETGKVQDIDGTFDLTSEVLDGESRRSGWTMMKCEKL